MTVAVYTLLFYIKHILLYFICVKNVIKLLILNFVLSYRPYSNINYLLLLLIHCISYLFFYRSSQTYGKPKFLQYRLDSKGSDKLNNSEERCKSPGSSWRRPPLPKSLSGSSFNGDHFMDREYMQQMQRRLLDQHEETLRRRIKQRQVSYLNYLALYY